MIQNGRFRPQPVVAVPDPDDPALVTIQGKQHRLVEISGKKYYEGIAVMCPSDHLPMKLRPSKYGLFYGCPMYPACYHTLGAHPDGRPLGIPGDFKTREARMQVHAAFDPIWKSKYMKRWDAYLWMAKALGMAPGAAHVAEFDYAMCERVLQVIRTYRSTLPQHAQEVMARLEQLDLEQRSPRGLMDKASASEAEVSRFDPERGGQNAPIVQQLGHRTCNADTGVQLSLGAPIPLVVEIEERAPSSTERAAGFYPADEGSSPSGRTIKRKLADFVRTIPS